MKKINKKRIKSNASKSGKTKLIKDVYGAMGEMMEKIKECRSLESHKLIVPMANSKKTLGRGVMFELNSQNEYFFLGKVKKVPVRK